MDSRYNHRNRRKYSLKVHIVLVTKYRKQILKGSIADDVKQKIYDICGRNILTSYLSVTGNTRYFGQMVILLVVLARYHLLPYKSTSKAKVNGYEFTRLLPPPKGSGFPPTKPKGFYL